MQLEKFLFQASVVLMYFIHEALMFAGLNHCDPQSPCATNSIEPPPSNNAFSIHQLAVKDELASMQFCQVACQGFVFPTGPKAFGFCTTSGVRCFRCDCEPGCELYGTCCVKLGRSEQLSETQLYARQRQQDRNNPASHLLKCVLLTSEPRRHVLMVGGCAEDVSSEEDRVRCERETTPDKQTVADYRHVMDPDTGISYKNKFCSRCNGINDTEPWDLSIDCDHYQKVYTATSEDQLLQLSLSSSSGCQVNQWTTRRDKLSQCEPDWFDDLIYKCNVTGRWVKHDLDVQTYCERQSPLSTRVRADYKGEYLLFNNIHCIFCNFNEGDIGSLHFCNSNIQFPLSNGGDKKLHQPPLSLLLGFMKAKPQVEYEYVSESLYPDNCNETEWATPDGNCLPLECSPGKIAMDGNCTAALDQIGGLGYTVKLYLTAHWGTAGDQIAAQCQSFTDQMVYVKVFQDAVESILSGLPLDKYRYQMSPWLKHQNDDSLEQIDTKTSMAGEEGECFVSAKLVANKTYSRDYIEDFLVKNLVGNVTINDARSCLVSVNYYIIPSANEHEDLLKNATTFYEGSTLKSDTRFDAFRPSGVNIWDAVDTFIRLSNTLNCLFVSFNPHEYELERQEHRSLERWNISLEFKNAQLELSDPKDLSQVSLEKDGRLRVCQHTLQDNVKMRTRRRVSYTFSVNSAVTFWQSILTLVCMGASIVCLAATVVTYCLFATLRSTAGWHNLFLSLTLLLAQSLLLASTYVDGPSTWCTVLGVATHYSWLSVFCWSFACCFHMFRVFTAKTRLSGRSQACAKRLSLLKRVAFSAGVPALVVAAVMVGVSTETHGQDLGYGKRSCYLDSALLVGVATILPLGLVTICNIVFFAAAVFKIYSVRKLQASDSAKAENTKHLFVYIRLSTLTGVCWTVALVAEAADNDPLRFIYIVLNGLQGVFIFLSYMCNRRVLLLYTGVDTGRKDTSTAASTATRSYRRHSTEITSSTFSSAVTGPD